MPDEVDAHGRHSVTRDAGIQPACCSNDAIASDDGHANRRAMTEYKSDLLRLLDARGYIHQVTDADGLDALAAKQIVPGYIGFDATAPSLHVGSLVQIMMLRRLQQAGHKPIVLMGGGTTKIGDPSRQGREPQAAHRTRRSTPTSPRSGASSSAS